MATFRHVEVIEAWIWGQRVGAVAWDPNRRTHVFEYDPAWSRGGVQLAPIMMPVDPGNPAPASRRFLFPSLDEATFKHLPGLLSDALPDAFGNQLIDAWMATHGYSAA